MERPKPAPGLLLGNWDEPNPNAPPPTIHYVPGANEDASFLTTANVGTPFTVTYNGLGVVNSLNGSLAGTLDIIGGSLTLLAGGAFNSMGINVGAGATLSVSSGPLVVTSGNYASAVSGAGSITFVFGVFNLNAGTTMTIDRWTLSAPLTAPFPGPISTAILTYAKAFTIIE